jgi:error-prone DNA polymerase
MGGGAGHRRVLVHSSGFRQSPYADIKPPGEDARDTRRMLAAEARPERAERAGEHPAAEGAAVERERERERVAAEQAERAALERAAEQAEERRRRGAPPRKLWHASPGSSGR